MKAVAGMVLGVLVAGVVVVTLTQQRALAELDRAAALAAEAERDAGLAHEVPETLDSDDALKRLQERFDALEAEHRRTVARLAELEAERADTASTPKPYAYLEEAVAYWKALLEDEDRELADHELLQALAADVDLVEDLLTDMELDRDVRELAANALGLLDEDTQARIMDSVFADHELADEIGRTRIALIDAMSGFEDPRNLRHLTQLNGLIDSRNEPGLDHYAAIVITAHDGPDADAAFARLVESDSDWVREKLPVLKALHDPPVDHGAFVISETVDGYLQPGDAVVECNGKKIDGWKDLRRLVEATDEGTLVPFVVVDVNGNWVTRHVPGRADLRCLGRDL